MERSEFKARIILFIYMKQIDKVDKGIRDRLIFEGVDDEISK